MISKMLRYDIVLYAGEQEHFVERLRELGLVDITTTGWEPSEGDRELLLDIEAHNRTMEFLSSFKASAEFKSDALVFESGREAFEACLAARNERTRLQQEVARLEKLAQESAPWGRFSSEDMARLAERGVTMSSAYVSSTSSPTRNSIMTGMNSARSRHTNYGAKF